VSTDRAFPVLQAGVNVLAHVPDLVGYGSKPAREIRARPGLAKELRAGLRRYEDAVGYLPNQTFIGARRPEEMVAEPRPWWPRPVDGAVALGRDGAVLRQELLYALLRIGDRADLVRLTREFVETTRRELATAPGLGPDDLRRLGEGTTGDRVEEAVARQAGLPLVVGEQLVGCLLPGHDEDATLAAAVLLENLACKVTAAWALRALVSRAGSPTIDYVLSASEEAVGDRYQRGGGNLAKAIAEMAGVDGAVGMDVKAFCAGPLHALVVAAALVQAGLARRVAVVGGGSLPKLGMKFLGHLAHGYPILEDVLAAVAFLVAEDDGVSPRIRTDLVGRHPVGLSSAQQAIIEALTLHPLRAAGLRLTDVDRFAPELHNPEITLPANSGDVPLNNFRMIGAVAALHGEIAKTGIDDFVARHGMPGFSPTQGHIASAVCYVPHALDGLRAGRLQRVLFMARGSLFLGRMTELADGVSVLVERQGAEQTRHGKE
jgi:hypothetical protein